MGWARTTYDRLLGSDIGMMIDMARGVADTEE
jgi:hypothetical protein